MVDPIGWPKIQRLRRRYSHQAGSKEKTYLYRSHAGDDPEYREPFDFDRALAM